jgi:ABC-type multidrug transport system ATPase subunit
MVYDLFHSYFNLRSDQVVSFMDTLLCDDLLGGVNITWGEGFSVDFLSEGEKQLILSVGLGLVMKNRNLLFLFDEPDVSLHPKWQQEFIPNMMKGLDNESMAIITTHSPILVGNLQDSFVRELQRGKVCTKGPRFSFGRDVNSILEDYFRIEERNKGGKALIDAFYDAMNKKDYDEAETLLEKLNKLFGPTDVTTIKATSLFDDLAE